MIAARCDCGTATPATQLAAFGRCPTCVKVERLVDLAMHNIPQSVCFKEPVFTRGNGPVISHTLADGLVPA